VSFRVSCGNPTHVGAPGSRPRPLRLRFLRLTPLRYSCTLYGTSPHTCPQTARQPHTLSKITSPKTRRRHLPVHGFPVFPLRLSRPLAAHDPGRLVHWRSSRLKISPPSPPTLAFLQSCVLAPDRERPPLITSPPHPLTPPPRRMLRSARLSALYSPLSTRAPPHVNTLIHSYTRPFSAAKPAERLYRQPDTHAPRYTRSVVMQASHPHFGSSDFRPLLSPLSTLLHSPLSTLHSHPPPPHQMTVKSESLDFPAKNRPPDFTGRSVKSGHGKVSNRIFQPCRRSKHLPVHDFPVFPLRLLCPLAVAGRIAIGSGASRN
jgi:hypothetical protein